MELFNGYHATEKLCVSQMGSHSTHEQLVQNYRQLVQSFRFIYDQRGFSTEEAQILDLEPGCYLVVAFTEQPGIDMKFLLRIFTDVEISSG